MYMCRFRLNVEYVLEFLRLSGKEFQLCTTLLKKVLLKAVVLDLGMESCRVSLELMVLMLCLVKLMYSVMSML